MESTYQPRLMVLHLEGNGIEDLRAQAILALDLRIVSHTTAANAVDELQAEPAPAPEPEMATSDVNEPANPEAETQEKKPAKKRRTKAEMQAAQAKAEPVTGDAKPVTGDAKPLTLESVRSAFDEYVKTFGVSAAQTDGPILLSRVFGNGIQRIKDIPEDDTGKIGRIIAAVQGAILTNEFNRPAVQ